jgi:predicted nucleic acid-binding protein
MTDIEWFAQTERDSLQMLVDTDVLIWHLRGYAQATRRLDTLDALTLSAVSYIEVLQGMRNKTELAALKKMLERRSAVLLPLTETITRQAVALMEALTLSHGLQMGDALIAATALEHRLPLLTGNVKHFAAIEHLQVEGFAI